MNRSFFPIALLGLALASCGGTDKSAAPATPSSGSSVELQSPLSRPEVEQALAFADSLGKLPHVTALDIKAGQDYTKAVSAWYESDLNSSIKTLPEATRIWANYRTVLRMVVKSRGLKKVKPEDAQSWEALPGQCAQVAATLLPLTQDKPAPTSDKAVPQLQAAWSAMSRLRFTAERYMLYLESPHTRTKRFA
jgi:hypothetical protein